jgi:hypothetical protein
MEEQINISLPKNMHLVERLSEVNRRLSEWLDSLERPFLTWRDELQLIKCQRNGSEYNYQYMINRDSRVSGQDNSSPYGFEDMW